MTIQGNEAHVISQRLVVEERGARVFLTVPSGTNGHNDMSMRHICPFDLIQRVEWESWHPFSWRMRVLFIHLGMWDIPNGNGIIFYMRRCTTVELAFTKAFRVACLVRQALEVFSMLYCISPCFLLVLRVFVRREKSLINSKNRFHTTIVSHLSYRPGPGPPRRSVNLSQQ